MGPLMVRIISIFRWSATAFKILLFDYKLGIFIKFLLNSRSTESFFVRIIETIVINAQ